MRSFLRRSGIRGLVHLAALLPMALLLWDSVHGQLSADPVREAILRTGRVALLLLLLSLACTPATRLRFSPAKRFRRTLGLYAFGYAVLHLAFLLGLDYRFDLELAWGDLSDKRYALAGLGAFLLLLPLAATSSHGWRRRLGHRWGHLHRLAYPAALLAVAHFLWATKGDPSTPLAHGAMLLLLLLLRLAPRRTATPGGG